MFLVLTQTMAMVMVMRIERVIDDFSLITQQLNNIMSDLFFT